MAPTDESPTDLVLVLDSRPDRRDALVKAVQTTGAEPVVPDNPNAPSLLPEIGVVLVGADALGAETAKVISDIKARRPDLEVVVVSDTDLSEPVREALFAGATDLVKAGQESSRQLQVSIVSALQRCQRALRERAFFLELMQMNERFLKHIVLAEKRTMELEDRLSSKIEGLGSNEKTGANRILLVEDEREVLTFMKDMLQAVGYDVVTAESAQEGYELFFERRCDLVVTDKNLPEMNGLELLASIREIEPEVPVILVTGFASVESAIEAMDLGVSAYIQKPFNTKEFLAKVEQVLTGRRSVAKKKEFLVRIKERNKKLLDGYDYIRARLKERLSGGPEGGGKPEPAAKPEEGGDA